MIQDILLFNGSSHPTLTKKVADALGLTIASLRMNQFPDGETSVEVMENVEEREVYLLQSIVKEPNHYLMELLILVDALKRASAKKIIAIIPHLAYCRQDRRNKPGVPITAKLVANLLTTAGVDHLMTFDLHADQIEGFYDIPVDHLHSHELLLQKAEELIAETFSVVVAPDTGSIKIAEALAKLRGVDIAVVKKERLSTSGVKMRLIGDVKGKNVLISDDLCSTANTLVSAAELCRQAGAKKIVATVSHGLFVEKSLEKIEKSTLDWLITTDTVPHDEKVKALSKIVVVSVCSKIVKFIRREKEACRKSI